MSAITHEIRNLSGAVLVVHKNFSRLPELQNNEDFRALGTLVEGLGQAFGDGIEACRGAAFGCHRIVQLSLTNCAFCWNHRTEKRELRSSGACRMICHWSSRDRYGLGAGISESILE